jgi:cell division protein ZapD
VASRSDLKSELLKELDRHKTQFMGWRNNPQVEQGALGQTIGRLEASFQQLNQQSGKAGLALSANEWLSSLRSRIGIPGGTCEFDLPAYHAWQQREPARRRADLMAWAGTLAPLGEALRLMLQLVRETGAPHRVITHGGQFQQNLPSGRSYQLLRLRIDPALELVPEIACHRLLVSVRLLRVDAEGRLRPAGADAAFDVSLCG